MLDLASELVKTRGVWRKDPRVCAYSLFTDYLTPQQEEVLMSVFKFMNTFVRSGHGQGKSFDAAVVALCFLMAFAPSKVITLAPSWAQVEKILWTEIASRWSEATRRIAKTQEIAGLGGALTLTSLKLGDDHFAVGLSPKIESEDWGARITGHHSENTLVILDEAPSIDERLWEMIKTLLTGANSRLLAIGNPVKPAGAFYNGFQSPVNSRIKMDIFKTPNFIASGVKSMDDLRKLRDMNFEDREARLKKMKNPMPALVSVRWAVERLIEWGEDSPLFQSRVLANFPKKGGGGLVSLYDLEMCARAENTPASIKALGVDPARSEDRFVMFGLQNFREIFRSVQPGHDTTVIRDEIAHVGTTGEYDVIAIDVGGLGIGIYDALVEIKQKRRSFPAILPVNFAAAATQEHERDCANFITELWYVASKLIEKHEVFLKDEDTLFSELIGRIMGMDSHGKMLFEKKEGYKKRAKRNQSPDIADGFLIALAGILYGNPMTREVRSADRQIGGVLDEI